MKYQEYINKLSKEERENLFRGEKKISGIVVIDIQPKEPEKRDSQKDEE